MPTTTILLSCPLALILAILVPMFDIQALVASARVTLFGSGNRRGVDFDPARDIPSLTGKVLLITGGAGDLGKQVAIEFARHQPARIFIADLPREDGGRGVVDSIREGASLVGKEGESMVRYLPMDLSSFKSIKSAVAEFRKAAGGRLDLAVLNAGIMRVKPGVTNEGYEITFGVNYLGHALLTKLLMPTLLRTAELPGADVRVVAVSSEGHAMAPREGILFEKVKGVCEDVVSSEFSGAFFGEKGLLRGSLTLTPLRNTMLGMARAKSPSSAWYENWLNGIPRSRWLPSIQAA